MLVGWLPSALALFCFSASALLALVPILALEPVLASCVSGANQEEGSAGCLKATDDQSLCVPSPTRRKVPSDPGAGYVVAKSKGIEVVKRKDVPCVRSPLRGEPGGHCPWSDQVSEPTESSPARVSQSSARLRGSPER